MASPLNTASLIIIHRDENGKPGRICSHEESTVTHLQVAINVCREMLALPKVQQSFLKLAETFDKPPVPNIWFRQESKPLAELTKIFMEKTLARFPLVLIDESMKNPNYLGCSFRHA